MCSIYIYIYVCVCVCVCVCRYTHVCMCVCIIYTLHTIYDINHTGTRCIWLELLKNQLNWFIGYWFVLFIYDTGIRQTDRQKGREKDRQV